MASLDDPLRFLPGIGPARAAALEAAGWTCAWDVLHALPRLLGPPPPLCASGPLPAGEPVRVVARVLAVRPSFARGRGAAVEARLERADGRPLAARFFRAGWLRRLLMPGEWFLFEGRCDAQRGDCLLHPSFTRLAQGPDTPLPAESGCRTALPVPEGMSERSLQALVDAVLAGWLPLLTDPLGILPAADYQAALRTLHRPADADAFAAARRVLAARELAALAWSLQERRARITGAPGRAWAWDDGLDARIRARLPFALTPGQDAALADIRADLAAARPMYRLLHGEVGSGKTALALCACLAVVAHGAQALVLAPTGVLARQHAAFMRACLAGSRTVVELLTGGTPAGEAARIRAAAASGACHILVGTHALLEERVQLADCGLAVVDEQHKFGVHQRAALAAKGGTALAGKGGAACDLLLMTATPIPRTLALTAFGDLAVSRIAGRPPGRGAVATAVAAGGAARVLAEVAGHPGQALVVCPLREAGEAGEAADAAADAEGLHARLRAALGDGVDLLHGAMAEERKLAAIDRLAAGTTRVLVATTVVEVGIDVPGLDLLIVPDAGRFGLAQLHQLRGRLGRGERPGRCLLLSEDPARRARLELLAGCADGLAIAEADLAERGPGELLGARQHGDWRLRAADPVRDLDLLQDAHAWAAARLAAGGAPPAGLARWLPRGAAALLAGG